MQEKANLQLYFLLSRHLSLLRVSPIFPTRSALHTNTVRVEFTNTAQIQQKYKYNTAHEPSPALPMIAQFSRNYPRRPTAFYPKITHRQPLLIPTSAPFLWSRHYLILCVKHKYDKCKYKCLPFICNFAYTGETRIFFELFISFHLDTTCQNLFQKHIRYFAQDFCAIAKEI